MRSWTIRALHKFVFRVAALLASALIVLSLPGLASAAIETDPGELYTMMKHAYDEGTSKNWPFQSELYYQSTILDTGRAYSLFRPQDPNYNEVAQLAVDVATRLNYDPLTNNDASLWYVIEAANFVEKNGDDQHQAEAAALLKRLDAAQTDPRALAQQAEADALANAQIYRHDGDALVNLIVADVRAFNLTHDVAYRSALLQHMADPTTPLVRVPDPEYGQMFAIAQSALTEPGFSEADRAAARTVKYRRDHTPELKTIARVHALKLEARLTRTAPADEYFGNLKYSPIGVHNEIVRVEKYLEKGWGYRMESDALEIDSAVEDWQKQYPHDLTLPAALLTAHEMLLRVGTPKTADAAVRIKTLLAVQYPGSRQARELAAG